MPSIYVTGIRPKRFNHDAFIARFSLAVDIGNIAQGNRVFREEAAVVDHDFAVDDVGEGQVAEQLREEVVGLRVVLRLNLPFKAIHLVQLLRLVVASAHEEVLGEADLPTQHEHDDLNGEGAAVNEVTVEKVGILLGGVSIDFENVHQVVILAVNVTAHRDFLQFVNRYVYQGVQGLENLRRLLNNHCRVLLMKCFTLSLPLHDRNTPLCSHIFDAVQSWASVAVLDKDLFNVNDYFGLFMNDCLSKQLLFMGAESDLVLLASVFVVWLHLAHHLEGNHRHFHLP